VVRLRALTAPLKVTAPVLPALLDWRVNASGVVPPTAPVSVVVPEPVMNWRLSAVPPAVPLVVPVMTMLPPPAVPVSRATAAASATSTLSLMVMSWSAVTMPAARTVVAPEPSRVMEALPAPVRVPVTLMVPPAGERSETGSLKVAALTVMPPVPAAAPMVMELKPSAKVASSVASRAKLAAAAAPTSSGRETVSGRREMAPVPAMDPAAPPRAMVSATRVMAPAPAEMVRVAFCVRVPVAALREMAPPLLARLPSMVSPVAPARVMVPPPVVVRLPLAVSRAPLAAERLPPLARVKAGSVRLAALKARVRPRRLVSVEKSGSAAVALMLRSETSRMFAWVPPNTGAVAPKSFAAVPRRMSDPAAVTETVVVPPAVVMEPVWETAPPAMRARSWPTDDGPITSALASVTATLLAPLLFRLTAPVKSLAASVSVMGLAPASKAAVPPTVRPAAWERAPEAVRSRLPVVDPWMASAPVSLRKTLPPVLLRMRVPRLVSRRPAPRATLPEPFSVSVVAVMVPALRVTAPPLLVIATAVPETLAPMARLVPALILTAPVVERAAPMPIPAPELRLRSPAPALVMAELMRRVLPAVSVRELAEL
jgi:hypothetical protein